MRHRREIRFRGFSTSRHEWVYGLLVHQDSKRSIIVDRKGVYWDCYTLSVGQFIGAKALGEGDGWHWTAIMDDGTVKTFSKDHENITAFGWMKENGVSSMHPTNNGPDLYEYDIVSAKFTNGKRNSKKTLYTERMNCLIVFDHSNLKWRLQRLQAGKGYGNYYGSQLGWDIRLVGNSTEHPHLLVDKASNGKYVGALNELGFLVTRKLEEKKQLTKEEKRKVNNIKAAIRDPHNFVIPKKDYERMIERYSGKSKGLRAEDLDMDE